MRGAYDCGLIFRAVEPDFDGQLGTAWWAVDEALRRALIRAVHRRLPLRQDGRWVTVMHGGWRQVGDPRMPMRVVIPRKEGVAPRLGVVETVEALGIVPCVLGRLALGFGAGVVVAHARPGARPDDARLVIQLVICAWRSFAT